MKNYTNFRRHYKKKSESLTKEQKTDYTTTL